MSIGIHVKHLTKSYKVYNKKPGIIGSLQSLLVRKHTDISAVDDISFDIQLGELIGFIGPNGAGKTTTLKMLSGILYPSSGDINILGFKPFDRKNDFLRQISLVMGQKNQLIWDLPPIETFNLNQSIYGVPEQKYKKILDELVQMLEVEDVINRQTRKLSLGQRMKCELIAAMIHTPRILFLDEPTIGLDVVVQKKLRTFIKEYNRKYESTIILTSHYMGDVEELCERVMIIDQGKLGYDGKLKDLVRKYAQNKKIELVFLRPITKDQLSEYGNLVEYEPLRAVFEVPREDIGTVAGKILNDLPVDDLDISEITIEEIVRSIFEKSS